MILMIIVLALLHPPAQAGWFPGRKAQRIAAKPCQRIPTGAYTITLNGESMEYDPRHQKLVLDGQTPSQSVWYLEKREKLTRREREARLHGIRLVLAEPFMPLRTPMPRTTPFSRRAFNSRKTAVLSGLTSTACSADGSFRSSLPFTEHPSQPTWATYPFLKRRMISAHTL